VRPVATDDFANRELTRVEKSKSLNMIVHSETINIGTHLLGTLLFTVDSVRLVLSCAAPPRRTANATLLYHVAAALCFLCSTLFHALSDSRTANFWRYIDHLGIQIYIWASTCSFVAVAFPSRSRKRSGYIGCATAGLVAFATVLWATWYYEYSSQRCRTVMHIAFGALSTWPALDYWHNREGEQEILRAFVSLVVINSIGGWIFATELLDPVGRRLGLPDFSHAVMHVVVVYGARRYGRTLKAVRDRVSPPVSSCQEA
jgi:adiponectin receptor